MIRLPRVSNVTDVDALAAEPGVEVLVTTDPSVVAGADLAILPGSRSTVADLTWLREHGLADALTDRARRNAPVLGICGGYQMLADQIDDDGGVPRRPRSGPRAAARHRSPSGPQGARSSGRHAGPVTSSTRTRSTTASRHGPERRRAVPGRLPARSGLGHDVARHLRERRLPPRLAHHDRRRSASSAMATRSRWRPDTQTDGRP